MTTGFSRRTTRAVVALSLLLALLRGAGSGLAQHPGFPGRLAMVRSPGPGAPADIYTANPDGGELEKITSSPGDYRALDWSPDGRYLAFEKTVAGRTEVWVIGADGSDERRVSPPGVDRYAPSWSPDGRYLAVDAVGRIYRLDVTTGAEVLLRDRGTMEVTCLDEPWDLTLYYSAPSWSPDGSRIALIVSREFSPLPVGDTCDPNVNIKSDLGVMPASGGEADLITDDAENASEPFDGFPDWSPDGSEIAWMRGNAFTPFGIAVVSSSGGTPRTLANGFGARPRFSPDGTKLLITRDQNGDGKSELWTMNATNGSGLAAVVKDASHNLYQDWQPVPAAGLEVTLEAFGPDRKPLDGNLTLAQTVKVRLTLANTGVVDLDEFRFAGDEPLVLDPRSTGGLAIVAGPQPPIPDSLTLEPEETFTTAFEVTTTAVGRAAAHTKVFAKTPEGFRSQEVHSLLFDIADGAEITDALGRWLVLDAMDQFLQKTFREWYEGMAERGLALESRLREVLSSSQQLAWFGSLTELPLGAFQHAMARLRGVAPEMVAASMPRQDIGDATLEEMNRAYDESFRAELGKGVEQWVENWAELGSDAKKGLQDSWAEVMLTSMYVFGTATPEERMQFEAYSMALLDGVESSSSNVVNTIATEVPKWRENLTYLDEAADLAVADIFLLSPDLQAQMKTETEWRQNVLDLASSDPVGFQKAWAQRDAEIASIGVPLVFDTLLGGGVFKAGGAAIKGSGAAMMRAGRAAGVIDAEGNLVRGAKTSLKPSTPGTPRGTSLVEVAESERQGNWLDRIEGATVVQSGDLGKVYELPNLGGVPEVTLDAKAGILAQLEREYLAATGKNVRLAEVLKTSSPLRKADSVAKLELVGQKTFKPAMLDAGAPADALSEAGVWRSTTRPQDVPGFRNLSKARQQAALTEWKKATEAWAEFENPAPGSKSARLKECIGQRSRVPLDLEPNASGLQRFVTAEFEEVHVVGDGVEAKLFRPKYYEVEVFDVRANKTVNTKVVVDSPEALPQGPDADAVALGKVVGTDGAGNPIVEPFSRAEREFFQQRYIDRNIKARRLKPGSRGAIPDAAEHGVTLVMDDASATVSGKLLARYGVPFLPKRVGTRYLKRIAPFVSAAGSTPEQIAATYRELLAIVESEGGFSQHAVVVTSDSRYLGEVAFASW